MNVGDKVSVVKLPEDLPENNDALVTLFRGCLGKEFAIIAFDDDLAELHVGEAFGEPSDKHRIWLPREYLKRVEVSSRPILPSYAPQQPHHPSRNRADREVLPGYRARLKTSAKYE